MMLELIGLRAVWQLFQLNKRRTRYRTRRGSQGFTLVESLTAIAILAIALTALFQNYSSGLRAVRVIDNYTNASILAQSIMAETMASSKEPRSRRGRTGDFSWKVAALPANKAPQGDAKVKPFLLYRITVQVSWSKNRKIELNTVRLTKKQ